MLPPKCEEVMRDCENSPPYIVAVAALTEIGDAINVNTQRIDTRGEKDDDTNDICNRTTNTGHSLQWR